MLNARSYDDLINCAPDTTKSALSAKWDNELISFGNINTFPEYHGLYFVYLGEEVIYVGKANKQTIVKRCKQYIGNSSGATLRKKIERVKHCSERDAIEFIKANLKARFLRIDDVERISVIEEVAIWAFQPRLNAIKPETFAYEKLVL